MIYVTGDIHSDIRRFRQPEYSKLTEDDILIILGDFGLTFYPMCGSPEMDYKGQQLKLNELANYPWITLTLDGNHDNIVTLNRCKTVEKYGSPVGEIVKDKVYHLRRGNVYTIEDTTFFTFGGALSIDRDHRIMGISWWPQELSSREEESLARKNLKKHNYRVDYVLTHTPPKFIIDIMNRNSVLKVNDPVAKFLSALATDIEVRNLWYSGHMHDEATFVQYPQHAVIYKDLYKLGAMVSETSFELPRLY